MNLSKINYPKLQQLCLTYVSFRGAEDVVQGQIKFFLLLCRRLRDEYEKFKKESQLNLVK